MANVHWKLGIDGDWSNGLYWTGGAAPTSADSVWIDAPGTYTITLADAVQINELLIDAPGATLDEKKTGSFANTNEMYVYDGTVILRSANTMTFSGLYAGLVEIADGQALGNGGVYFEGGALEAIANLTLDNSLIAQADGTLSAAHKKTLTFGGSINLRPM